MSESYFEGYWLPISAADLDAVQGIIRQHEIFCALAPDANLYECLTWRRQAAHHQTEVCALFDRNVLSDVLHLVRTVASPHSEACGERERIGAAIMAFLQCSNITIEPSIALYENASRAPEELRLFRRADEVDPCIYTDIALGRSHSIPDIALPEPLRPIPEIDFNKSIKGRQNLTVATLKIAELELSDLPPVEKMKQYLHWSFSDFLFLAGPLLLAAAYFTPRRESALLKSLRSADRQKALKSVRNAVWDLQVIYQWANRVKRQQEENRVWLLCSRDRALRDIARVFLCHGDESNAPEVTLRKFFEINWGPKDGVCLAELALVLQRDEGNAERMVNRNRLSSYPDQLAAQLESNVLAWRPNDQTDQ